jgi:hypothetical protein
MEVVGVGAIAGLLIGVAVRVHSDIAAARTLGLSLTVAALLILNSQHPVVAVGVVLVAAYIVGLAIPHR